MSLNRYVADITEHFHNIDNLQFQLKIVKKNSEKIAFRDDILKWIFVQGKTTIPMHHLRRFVYYKITKENPTKEAFNAEEFMRRGKLSEKKTANLRQQLPYVIEEHH